MVGQEGLPIGVGEEIDQVAEKAEQRDPSTAKADAVSDTNRRCGAIGFE